MSVLTLASGVTANGDGAAANPRLVYDEQGLYQLKITGAGSATVKLQGKIHASGEWADINSVSYTGTAVSSLVQVVICPFMRVSVSGVSGSVNVSAWVRE